jgi:cytochrome b561
MRSEIGYGAGARFFHWLTVGMLLAIVPLGLVMGGLPRGALQNAAFITHESLGLSVLALTLLRFLWRLAHPAPPPSADLAPVEREASRWVHIALYLVLLALPITGYLFVSFSGIALDYFGLARVPALVAKDKSAGDLALAVHKALQWAIYTLAALHVGAALHHHFLRRNNVLRRMLPSLQPR